MGKQNISSLFGVAFPSFLDSLLRVSVGNRLIMSIKNKNVGEHSKAHLFSITATSQHIYMYTHNCFSRDLLGYLYIPVIQKELDIFRKCVWNNHIFFDMADFT